MTKLLSVLLLIALLSSACYSYHTAASALPPTGATVAVNLTDSGTVVLAREIGPGAETVEGELVGVGERQLTLAVRHVRLRNGLSNRWAGERVTFGRELVERVRERRLSRVRSTLFATGLAAGVGALATAFVGGGSSGTPGGGGGPVGPR
ncbi:MAG TPA: hypothetical protein VMM18_00740 [Gemmatimonadaceae bacterium]|nr:hypothetical protein [Gemmatimonadaceae bacterium]